MAIDRKQVLANMTPRQKIMIALFIIVVLIVGWQVMGLFGGSAPGQTPQPITANGAQPGGNMPAPSAIPTPQSAQLPKSQPLTPREAELIKLQQETQAKYIAAVNELQMLKVSREIAETNQAIMSAKFAQIKAEKDIVDLLTPPATPTIAPNPYAARTATTPEGATVSPAAMPQPGAQAQPAEVSYTVISVSQLQYKWSAVLSYQGNLYNVMVGDILPADGSKVSSIDKTGVVLERDGIKNKISLVPII